MSRFIRFFVLVLAVAGGVRYAAWAGSAGASKAKLAPQEAKILELTNAVRKEKKLRPLKINPLLTEVARKHSGNMARQGKMSHVLDGKGTRDRLKDARYAYLAWAENILVYRDFSGVAAKGFQMWMDSPLHRANILMPGLREIGIGMARNSKGQVYFTQVFGTPRKRR